MSVDKCRPETIKLVSNIGITFGTFNPFFIAKAHGVQLLATIFH